MRRRPPRQELPSIQPKESNKKASSSSWSTPFLVKWLNKSSLLSPHIIGSPLIHKKSGNVKTFLQSRLGSILGETISTNAEIILTIGSIPPSPSPSPHWGEGEVRGGALCQRNKCLFISIDLDFRIWVG